jgi:hypothetical protein
MRLCTTSEMAAFCERIVEQLRPDFDLEPSLRCRMGIVRDELLRLTNEQYKLVDALTDNARILIRGGAGTGKSLLAAREAPRIASQGGRVLLCCFNKLLAGDLRSALCDCPSLTVAHLHGYMAEIVTSDCNSPRSRRLKVWNPRLSFWRISTISRRMRRVSCFYVGTSRARVLLALFFSENVRDAYSECALRFAEMLSPYAAPPDC